MNTESPAQQDWVREVLLPRVVFVPFLIAKLLLLAVTMARAVFQHRERRASTRLCLEAGARGWESIEFKELLASAQEYLGAESVRQVVVQPGGRYVRQLLATIRAERPTHYMYDPRTGNQHPLIGLAQSFAVACVLRWHRVTPIVLLTDISLRPQRAQGAVVSACDGVVVTFLAARIGRRFFPHRRLVAPSLMPFSVRTLQSLERERANSGSPRATKALFVGLMYEPRITFLREVEQHLQGRDVPFELRGRYPGGPRIPDDMYWTVLCEAAVTLTTAEQIPLAISDWPWVRQLTYRYLEAMAAGTLLVAPEVPGIRRYFTPGEHFAAFDSAANAADTIEFYLRNDPEREALAARGQARAEALIRSRVYWSAIDVALGPQSLT